jgi:hypothetical protein
MKNISAKIVVLLAGLVTGMNATGASALPDCRSAGSEMHNCFGTVTYDNGNNYVGVYKYGAPNGQGTYTSANGSKYVGEFKDGDANGQGTLTLENGDNYVGEW